LNRRTLLCWIVVVWSATAINGQAQLSGGPIKFETVHFAQMYPCAPRAKQNCLSVEVDYPAIVGAPTAAAQSLINSSIHSHLFSNVDGSPGPSSGDELAVQLQDEYRDIQRRVPEYKTPWFDHRSATVLMNSAALFNVEMRMDQFTGEAHPNSLRVYTNVRPSGENLSLNDVVTEGSIDRLMDVVERHFRQTRKLAEDADLKLAGFSFNDGKFALPDNFGFAIDGLIFYYNSYEIAPYYFGPTEVKVPYGELREVLKTEFIPAQ